MEFTVNLYALRRAARAAAAFADTGSRMDESSPEAYVRVMAVGNGVRLGAANPVAHATIDVDKVAKVSSSGDVVLLAEDLLTSLKQCSVDHRKHSKSIKVDVTVKARTSVIDFKTEHCTMEADRATGAITKKVPSKATFSKILNAKCPTTCCKGGLVHTKAVAQAKVAANKLKSNVRFHALGGKNGVYLITSFKKPTRTRDGYQTGLHAIALPALKLALEPKKKRKKKASKKKAAPTAAPAPTAAKAKADVIALAKAYSRPFTKTQLRKKFYAEHTDVDGEDLKKAFNKAWKALYKSAIHKDGRRYTTDRPAAPSKAKKKAPSKAKPSSAEIQQLAMVWAEGQTAPFTMGMVRKALKTKKGVSASAAKRASKWLTRQSAIAKEGRRYIHTSQKGAVVAEEPMVVDVDIEEVEVTPPAGGGDKAAQMAEFLQMLDQFEQNI